MPDNGKIDVVLCWHMHQPQYWDCERNEYRLPWTYLHGIKDYVDMAAHIEATPKAKAVINFTPTLLEQIDDYATQIDQHLQHGTPISDPLLSALANPVLPCSVQERAKLIHACMKANENRLINRYPPYRRLADIVHAFMHAEDGFLYLGDQFIVDILVWYHITWMGEFVRREDQRVQRLIDKGRIFNLHDRKVLMEVIGELLGDIIPRYRRLAANGQVELSVTPYAHPIAPLLIDIACTHEAMPEAPLPSAYPGGDARMQWHIDEGVHIFQRYFGCKPNGCWPAEGAISTQTIAHLNAAGFRWTASGQTVLHNSLTASGQAEALDSQWLHKAYTVNDLDIKCFFRDDGLSDLIGFHYADWHADDAISNMINHLETIASITQHPEQHVVAIVLDGENAWEYYAENGYHFLQGLYTQLSENPSITLTTFSEHLDKKHTQSGALPSIIAGSWVYGTFSTWIGEKDKNRGWEMLVEVKLLFDQVIAAGTLNAQQSAAAERQLAICEGSDWFWWFGDYNSEQSVSDFECLYRVQLTHLYRLLKQEPPDYLSHVFTFGGGHPENDGVMIRNT